MLWRLAGTFAVAGGLVLMTAAASASPARTAVTQAPSDDALKDRVDYRLETSRLLRRYDLDVKVRNRVVTLTGDVATAAQKTEAARLARVDGVTQVENMITVDPDEDQTVTERMKKNLNKAGEVITDAWITAKVKWFFLGDDALAGSDINVDARDRVVTLKGTVRTAAGKARARELAAETEGVAKVVNELVVKG